MKMLETKDLKKYYGTVSYTHLDVYKRQSFWSYCCAGQSHHAVFFTVFQTQNAGQYVLGND